MPRTIAVTGMLSVHVYQAANFQTLDSNKDAAVGLIRADGRNCDCFGLGPGLSLSQGRG